MAKNLLIVESPAKAKTIEKYLGSDFEVKSSYGHVRDLDKDNMGIDVAHNYLPKYIVPEDKKKVVTELKQQAKKVQEVWLASDEDREGEAISWHLAEVLGLDPKTTKRIVFHEITKPAIENAVKNPRTIDMNLVDAQQARRILDRLVGFELSPVLWRKVGMQRSLSAGRVQSVAVKLIAEREREINAFKAESSFKVEGHFVAKDINKKDVVFKADGPAKLKSVQDAETFLDSCKKSTYKVVDVQVKPTKRTPAAPFTTSTLQQEASRKLGYSVSRTMRLAQQLYENGLITYMRTDAVNLSELAMADIEKEINQAYGANYHKPRHYKNKNENAQEAHEAIRPTYIHDHTITDADTRALYNLIWKRTIASQMSDAEFEKTNAKIEISSNKEQLNASGEVLKFDGFLKVYLEGRDDDDDEEKEGVLPPLAVGQAVDLKEIVASEKFSRPAPRYTEASLVKKLEELGIGRPSTYAPTITTITKRNYVEKRDKDGVERAAQKLTLNANDEIAKVNLVETFGTERGKLFPTDLGLVVTDFLSDHFKNVMDYHFTARVENEFDEIAGGKLKWNNMIDGFYQPFHENVESTMETAERVKGERELGTTSEGKKIIARMGRFGPMVQIGSQEDEEKPQFAALRKDQSIETITLDEALELFKLPRNLGKFEGEDVMVNIGRFGPYAMHDKKFYSLTKEMDPYSVELDEVGPLIEEKRKAKEERTIKIFEKEKIQVLKGPYGPYLKVGLRNYKLNKEQQDKVTDLTVEEAKAIIEEQKANPPKKRKAATTKKKKA
ncbi:type I DNA topoisomerase [Rhizosphaericola mali]|uniref:DNA topoisomerase 1 n=1 Tax=Rhizosphaericola mali TaxID=2545455 RepID=A0A5P2G4V9_9BACT|nr:type I DNA topoisomerase [Rhizosphaericola mali]QES89728.1 type I DNA topoisomerase [Rhizosphaericola mali]